MLTKVTMNAEMIIESLSIQCNMNDFYMFSGPATSHVRHLSVSINGRRHFRSHQSMLPACTHCAPLFQTVHAAISNGRPHCSHWSHCAHFL